MNKEEPVNMYCEKFVKKKDFSVINCLTMQHFSQKFPEEEIWEPVLCFTNNGESYLKTK